MLHSSSVSWAGLLRRTWRDALEDDVFGLAAQLAYYFFLALFPAILFLLAIASFFSLSSLTDDLARAIGPFVSPQILELIQNQMRRLADNENGGLLTFGVAGALWSSSAALVSIVGALNKAYDIEEGRPWWKVRVVAIGLTVGVAAFVLVALSLVLAGPSLADYLGNATGLGPVFEWTWLILQWPLIVALVATAVGLVYYFGPDADQDWVWISPGAVVATILWLVVSLLFKLYIANFTDYDVTYGAVSGVIVLMLWFYLSSLAVLAGAELNAEIEHASPHGKAPGQKSAKGKVLLGRRAEERYNERQSALDINRFSTVVFDVDGTLIDSNTAHAEAWAGALADHGVQRPVDHVRRLIGMGADKLLPELAGEHERSSRARAITARKKERFAEQLPRLRPTAGARALVAYLAEQKKTLVVATSADEEEMDALLAQAEVGDLFARRTSKDDAKRSKPDPDIVKAALGLAGASPTEAIMIGDTPYDIEAARRAGLEVIVLRSGGYWPDEKLAVATAIFDDPAALLAHWRGERR